MAVYPSEGNTTLLCHTLSQGLAEFGRQFRLVPGPAASACKLPFFIFLVHFNCTLIIFKIFQLTETTCLHNASETFYSQRRGLQFLLKIFVRQKLVCMPFVKMVNLHF
jgi:hypothetical protein